MAAEHSSEPLSLTARHESQSSQDGKSEVKFAFAFKKLDWDEYHRFRPVYPASMWKMWLDYHRAHGGAFDRAVDLGTGPGTAAPFLAPHFAHLTLSDPGKNNLESARAHLESRLPEQRQDRLAFVQSPAEEIYKHLPGGDGRDGSSSSSTVDLATCCMALHYADPDAAMASVARMLRRGTGTFAAVVYSFRLRFPGRPRLDELWLAAAARDSERLLRVPGLLFPTARRGLARAMSGLDFVPLAETGEFEDVRRVYVNVEPEELAEAERRGDGSGPFCFVKPDAELWEKAPSRVQEGRGKEERLFVRDEGWRREVDSAWLRGFLGSCQMGFGEDTWRMDEWQALEAEVNAAPGGVVTAEWPVAIVLARRKK